MAPFESLTDMERESRELLVQLGKAEDRSRREKRNDSLRHDPQCVLPRAPSQQHPCSGGARPSPDAQRSSWQAHDGGASTAGGSVSAGELQFWRKRPGGREHQSAAALAFMHMGLREVRLSPDCL